MGSLEKLGIGMSKPCFIIAEIGQNHQGDFNMAKELITIAKECGVNCVKFQKSNLQERFTQRALQAPYESIDSFGPTYGEHRAKLEFSDRQFKQLQRFAMQQNILFTASPMDIKSANLLISMKVPFIKIGSGDTNNYPLIEHVAKSKIPIILSTGMQNYATVKHALAIITKYHQEVVLLHCVSSYPTHPSDVNLAVIDLYKKEFPQIVIGYSGHEKGIHIAIAAVAKGAKVIEKHFTKDKLQKGTDHKCSLDPTELADLVKYIRETESAIGVPVKRILCCEEACLNKLGKSIVTRKRLLPGSISMSDLAIKVSRPVGLKPELIETIIGLKTHQVIEKDTPLQIKDDVVIALN